MEVWYEHEGMPDGLMQFINDAQGAVNRWLCEGGMVKDMMRYARLYIEGSPHPSSWNEAVLNGMSISTEEN